MGLSSDLISQFAKITRDDEKKTTETIVYGTAVKYNGKIYARLDGSDRLTPIITTANIREGDRVTVVIKNHSAIVTGNITSPAANQGDVDEVGGKVDDAIDQITELEIVVAGKVSTEELEAEIARIDQLVAEDVTIKGDLEAANAKIRDLEADNVTITGDLEAANAEIENLKVTKLDAEIADISYAKIGDLEATNAEIHNLKADYGEFKDLTAEKLSAVDAEIKNLDTEKLSADEADLKYANIDFANIGKAAIENFFSKSGMIGDLVVGDGTITGTLVGVTIKGDLIEGGTVKADKLVVQGEDGLYYKLNVTGETVAAEQTEYNSLSGSIITAKSITAEKVAVNDLVAFDATIGGFNITESSIYSGVKESVDNTTRGVFLGDDGQVAIGDQAQFLKFFKDDTGNYKLEISASTIKFGASNKNLEDVISDEIQNGFSDIEIGGRNLLLKSDTPYSNTESPIAVYDMSEKMVAGEKYTCRIWGELGAGKTDFELKLDGETISLGELTDNEDGTYSLTFDGQNSVESISRIHVYAIPDTVTVDSSITKIKLEVGTMSTDWSPAPEDMATSDDVRNAQDTANTANDKANTANDKVTVTEATLKILQDSISTLVTDENGNSMMTQTGNGWTFNMGGINDSIENAANKLNELSGTVDEVNAAIGNLNSLADDLAKKTAYIVMTTDETGAPCIELGKSDNDFKVRITNTSIDFMDGTSKIAYVSNQALYIGRAVIKEELKIGEGEGFIWKKRSNGNMGLRWVGG